MNIERPSIPKYFSESLTLEDLGIYSDDEIGYQPNKRPIFTVYVENNRNTLNNDLSNNRYMFVSCYFWFRCNYYMWVYYLN